MCKDRTKAKKHNLRRVNYFDNVKASPHTDKVKRVLAGTGLFHCWASDYDEYDEGGVGNFTIALIELGDGKMIAKNPLFVEFMEDEE